MMLLPNLMLPGVLGDLEFTATNQEQMRFFGVMVFTLGGCLLGMALRDGNLYGTTLVLKGLFVGDVLFTALTARYCFINNFWAPPALFNVGFSFVLLVFRVICIAVLTSESASSATPAMEKKSR